MDRGAWWATIHEFAKSGTLLRDYTHIHKHTQNTCNMRFTIWTVFKCVRWSFIVSIDISVPPALEFPFWRNCSFHLQDKYWHWDWPEVVTHPQLPSFSPPCPHPAGTLSTCKIVYLARKGPHPGNGLLSSQLCSVMSLEAAGPGLMHCFLLFPLVM